MAARGRCARSSASGPRATATSGEGPGFMVRKQEGSKLHHCYGSMHVMQPCSEDQSASDHCRVQHL